MPVWLPSMTLSCACHLLKQSIMILFTHENCLTDICGISWLIVIHDMTLPVNVSYSEQWYLAWYHSLMVLAFALVLLLYSDAMLGVAVCIALLVQHRAVWDAGSSTSSWWLGQGSPLYRTPSKLYMPDGTYDRLDQTKSTRKYISCHLYLSECITRNWIAAPW